jgi:tryptophan synthase alpha chain
VTAGRGSAARSGRERLEEALRAPARSGRVALVAYLTAGYPDRERFPAMLTSVAETADVVEVGVPFSDPMADGVTIQRASREALAAGVSLRWILAMLAGCSPAPRAPIALMSYLNPLLAFGLDRLAGAALEAGVAGFIVPDLPFEESAPLRASLAPAGIALVQMVTPVTPPERLARICGASEGFTYAVTVTGTTGGSVAADGDVAGYLQRARAASPVPLMAGFGIREASQVRALAGRADGVIVGSALIEAIESGRDPADFLRRLVAESNPPHRAGNAPHGGTREGLS